MSPCAFSFVYILYLIYTAKHEDTEVWLVPGCFLWTSRQAEAPVGTNDGIKPVVTWDQLCQTQRVKLFL